MKPRSPRGRQAHLSKSPVLNSAVDVAIAGAAGVGRVSRRIIQRIWDFEPVNNTVTNEAVWCLGCSYTLDTKMFTTAPSSIAPEAGVPTPLSDTLHQEATTGVSAAPEVLCTQEGTDSVLLSNKNGNKIPGSVSSSFNSTLAYEDPGQDAGWPQAFIDDFESRIWMTYRAAFEIIPKSENPRAGAALSFATRLKSSFGDHNGFASDAGWGCMIRSGQSLLANALAISRLGREWRRGQNIAIEKDIISLFADDPRAPYSIHNFVGHGAVFCQKYPGEWFGPSATARCIEALTNTNETSLRVYSTGNLPDVYEDSFMALAKPDGDKFYPTILLIGTRLGIDRINQVYEQALIATLQMPQSVGIAGGRPSSSFYFVGAQGQKLFYLDPHHTRPALPYYQNSSDYTISDVNSCHTRRLRQLHVSDMDPSMLIGFLIQDEEDWDMWKSSVKHVQGKAIITVSDHDPARGQGPGRAEAIDEVETISDDEGDDVHEP